MSVQQEKKKEIEPALIVPFVQSVRKVLATMAQMETTIGRPYGKQKGPSEHDCSGIIGFSGKVIGTVVVSFPLATASKLVAAFAGDEVDPQSSDFADAIGELTNMIAGAAKPQLGGDANITVPSVIMGRGHTVSRPSDIPCLVLPCSTVAGEFIVEIAIRTA